MAVLVLSVAVAGCDKTPPTAPPAPPAPRVLTINCGPGACQMDVGSERNLTASVIYTDGSRHTERTVWTTDDATIATVDDNGGVRGIRSGTTTIRAAVGALTAGLHIRVNPRTIGQWKGKFVTRDCETTGSFDFKAWCTDFYTAGYPFDFELLLREEDGTLSGWISISQFGGLALDEGGSLDADGRVRVSARGDAYGGWMGPVIAIVGPLQAQLRDPALEGGFVLTIVGEPGSGMTGSVVVDARLDSVSRQ